MGETSTNVANVKMAQGLKIRVEDGCDIADPCDSNICPENSQCSDDWSTHTCVCDPGNTHFHKPLYSPSELLYINVVILPQVILVRSVWMPASSTHASMFPPAFANQVPHMGIPVNVDKTTTASTAKTSKFPSSLFI